MPTLLQALRDKAPYVEHVRRSSASTPRRSRPGWPRDGRRLRAVDRHRRARVADPQKLLTIAARIGVADARRFLAKNLRFVMGLARSGGFYKPTRFVQGVAPLLADPGRA